MLAAELRRCDATEQIGADEPLPVAEAAVGQRRFAVAHRSRRTTAQSVPKQRSGRGGVDVSALQSLASVDQSGADDHERRCPDGLMSVVPQSNQPTPAQEIAASQARLPYRHHSINQTSHSVIEFLSHFHRQLTVRVPSLLLPFLFHFFFQCFYAFIIGKKSFFFIIL